MRYLTTILIALCLLTHNIASATRLHPVKHALWSASQKAKVPHFLLKAICFVESSYNPKALNKYDGGSGSYGLCQIKLSTARFMGFSGRVRDLYKPDINALYAAYYLRHQMDRYRGDWIKAISAYNRGNARKINKRYTLKVLRNAIKEA